MHLGRPQSRAQTTPGGSRPSGGIAARQSLNQKLFDGRMRSPFQMKQNSVFPRHQLSQQDSLERSFERENHNHNHGPGSRPGTTPGGSLLFQTSLQRGRGGGGGGSYNEHSLREGSLTGTSREGTRMQTNWTVLRVKLPTYLNTPDRKDDGAETSAEERYFMLKKVSDLELLLSACRRSGKLREEGRCCFSLAVLHDNLKEYKRGLKYYTEFLKICRDCEDKQGQALAYHSLASTHQVLGMKLKAAGAENGASSGFSSPRGGGSSSSTSTSPTDNEKTQQLKTAIYFHNKHRKIADSVGKFIAHANLGLCYGALAETEAATLNHQYALQFALQLHSVEGQSLAIGNLAVSSDDSVYEQDPTKLRALIERYIQLCDTLNHDNSTALKKLGTLCVTTERNFEKGIGYYQRALEVAGETGDRKNEKSVLVSMGILQGFSKMETHLKSKIRRAHSSAWRV
mmetsp:Transcript_13751/g.33856  ORF Transcript_13751/g.33856 Transcript_13751/m.33856 type:complete len:456 (+) Transcript_13751:209-1576(+)|eukprot:CAMPEP_0178987136 /NCGR_PEP_ID=MMETSP0795-20121207/3092_1 /TAXON_ID=88552 /ORGANISM="Amoebophrya sp., Strain Ameob2" /LENGTH=455 /DNA_ID=CAMNT_0020678275 /DNA_START=144 /DNA_END=1511 /DNA_ORIENTATION=+